MNREQVMDKVNAIFREVFDDDAIAVGDQSTADDIEDWDSLTHLQLIVEIEKRLGIHFKLGEINGFANVGELVDCIIGHLG